MTKETYNMVQDEELPAYTFVLDIGWGKGSDRAYDSPTRTMNACGFLSGKICESKPLCKRCTEFYRLKRVRDKKETAVEAKKKKK